LLSSNWLNVGPVITGTGQVITAEDPGATDLSAPRFYRLLRTQ
jgi:hypothetical protein